MGSGTSPRPASISACRSASAQCWYDLQNHHHADIAGRQRRVGGGKVVSHGPVRRNRGALGVRFTGCNGFQPAMILAHSRACAFRGCRGTTGTARWRRRVCRPAGDGADCSGFSLSDREHTGSMGVCTKVGNFAGRVRRGLMRRSPTGRGCDRTNLPTMKCTNTNPLFAQ